MRTPTLNRQRVALLRDVHAGKVYHSMGGCDLRQVPRGQNERVDRRVRELAEAGWVELGPDERTYKLTAAGELALSAVTP